MKKPPLTMFERLAQMIEARRAERAAKYARALAEYDRINARLRRRPPPEKNRADWQRQPS